jgi:hypothetical protein
MTYRVIQWATGGVGRAAIEAVLQHPDLDLVGCWVHSADKAGRDVGELIDGPDIGVRATGSLDEILAMDADCVVYAPLVPDRGVVVQLLRSGKNVVTPVGWVYPDTSRAGEILAACEDGQSSLHGTGIHPGGMTERFPLTFSAVTAGVTHVRSEEFSDIRTYGAPDVVRHVMGFGGTPEDALAGPMVAALGSGFRQSVRMVAHEMGLGAGVKITTEHTVAVATAPIDTPIGVIEPGQVAGQRFVWTAQVGETPVVTAVVNWLMGEEHLDPAWDFGDGGERYEIEIQGDPTLNISIKGLQPETVAAGVLRNPGVVGTANHCVSAIPSVVRAAPGITTYLDLPLIAGRMAPHLIAEAHA